MVKTLTLRCHCLTRPTYYFFIEIHLGIVRAIFHLKLRNHRMSVFGWHTWKISINHNMRRWCNMRWRRRSKSDKCGSRITICIGMTQMQGYRFKERSERGNCEGTIEVEEEEDSQEKLEVEEKGNTLG